MAAKQVQITATMGKGFKVECKAGAHTVMIDQPTAAGGTDAGPTPLAYLHVALAGCICAIGRIIASQRRLDIRGITVKTDGELDVDGLLGKEVDGRVGFTGLNAVVEIDADMSREEKEALLHEIDARCPISENISNATPVSVRLAE